MRKILPLILALVCIHTGFAHANTPVSIANAPSDKEIKLPAFTSLSVKGGGTYYVHYSTESKIVVTGQDQCLDGLDLTVTSDTLYLRPADNRPEGCAIDVHIYTSDIKGIQQKDGGSIVVEKGFPTIETFNCSLKDGGKLDLSALSINSLIAAVKGGGEVTATVNKSLNGMVKNGGAIYYYGDPAVEPAIKGGGTIESR